MYKQYDGLNKLSCPVMVAVKVEQAKLLMFTSWSTDEIGGDAVKQRTIVESVQES